MEEKNKQKIKHIWTVLCGASSVDKDSNQISLINVIEELTLSSIPQVSKKEINVNNKGTFGIPVQFEIVVFLQRMDNPNEDLTVDIEIDSVDPKGKVLKSFPYLLPFQKGFKRIRFRIKMNGLQYNSPGEYHFRIKLKEEDKFIEVASLPLDLKIKAEV